MGQTGVRNVGSGVNWGNDSRVGEPYNRVEWGMVGPGNGKCGNR